MSSEIPGGGREQPIGIRTETAQGNYYSLNISYNLQRPERKIHPIVAPIGTSMATVVSYPTNSVEITDASLPVAVDLVPLLPHSYHIDMVRIDASYLQDAQAHVPGLTEMTIARFMTVSPFPLQRRIAVPVYYLREGTPVDRDAAAELLVVSVGMARAFPRPQDWEKGPPRNADKAGRDFFRRLFNRTPRVLGKQP